MRYQMVLTACPATRERYWGTVLGEAASILDLFEKCGWRAMGLCCDQVILVLDTKQHKTLTEAEYQALIRKLKGWN